jgi:hypothetical protein
MSRLSPTRRLAAVVTALAATFAFSSASAIATDDADSATVRATTIQDKQKQDSTFVESQFDARSMKVAPRANKGKVVQVSVTGPRLKVGQRLNLIDVTILNGSRTQAWRAFWLFPKDGDKIAGFRLWDLTKATGSRPWGKLIKCKAQKGRFINGRKGLTIQMNIPRSCIDKPEKVRVNGKLWYVATYNKKNGFPKKGWGDGVPSDSGFTKAL